MAWAKVDDGWWCHPKVGGLDLAARGLWVSALSWSCAQRTALVPPYLIAMIGATEAHAALLVERGLWTVAEGGWLIHDWAEYQEKSLSEKRAEAGSKGGRRAAVTRASGKQTPSKPDLLSEANGQAGPSLPVPSRPDPSENSGSISGDTPPPAEPDAGPPPPVDVEQEARRALRLLGDCLADTTPGIANRPAFAASVRREALTDGRAEDLTRLVRGGLSAEAAVAALLPQPAPPRLAPVPAVAKFCGDCDRSGYLLPMGATEAVRCSCNPHPVPKVEAVG